MAELRSRLAAVAEMLGERDARVESLTARLAARESELERAARLQATLASASADGDDAAARAADAERKVSSARRAAHASHTHAHAPSQRFSDAPPPPPAHITHRSWRRCRRSATRLRDNWSVRATTAHS